MKVWLGIDLGTTNSEAAVYFPDDKKTEVVLSDIPERMYEEDGKHIVPSVVSYDIYGKVAAVGVHAKRSALSAPENTVQFVKRIMGKSYEEALKEKGKNLSLPYEIVKGEGNKALIKVGNREIAPEDVAAEILKKIRENAERFVRDQHKEDMEIEKAYITVPAYFDDRQKNATKEAARSAGFDIENPEKFDLIEEPVAAMCCYTHEGKLGDVYGSVMVFDIGAGTLDIVIVSNVPGEGFIIKDITGNTELGGADMDNAILNWVKGEIGRDLSKAGINWDHLLESGLREHVEKAKILLSKKEKVYVTIPEYKAIELTRDVLNKLVTPFVNKCREKIREGLKNAGTTKEKISKVILVGGPTKMPIIQRIVEEEIGKGKILADISPMVCVAMGAAAGEPVGLAHITARSFGLYWINSYVEVVEKGTLLPTEKSVSLPLLTPDFEVHPLTRREEQDDETGLAYATLGKIKFFWPELGEIEVVFNFGEKEKDLSVIVKYGGQKADLKLFDEFEIIHTREGPEERDDINEYIIESLAKEVPFILVRIIEAAMLCEYFNRLPLGMLKTECRDEVKQKTADLESLSNGVYVYILMNLVQECNLTPALIQKIKKGSEIETDRRLKEKLKTTGETVKKSREFNELGIKAEELKRLRDRCVIVTTELVKEWIERGNHIFQLAGTKQRQMQEQQQKTTQERMQKLHKKIKEIEDIWEKVLSDSEARKKAFFSLQDLEAELMAAAGIREEDILRTKSM